MRGGEEESWKECSCRSWSSSSEMLGESRIVDVSEANETLCTSDMEGRERLRFEMGEDWGSEYALFHVRATGLAGLTLVWIWELVEGRLSMGPVLNLLMDPWLLPERLISSEKTGAVNGDELGGPAEKH